MQASTGTIIRTIEKALKSGDAPQLGHALANLARVEPSRWMTLLYLNGIIPEPGTNDLREALPVLFKGLQHALQDTSFPTDNFLKFVLPLLSLHVCFSSITERLQELTVWEEPAIRLIIRIAAFLEDQVHLMEDRVNEEVEVKGYYDPRKFISDNIPAVIGGADASLLDGYEQGCENLQLILAYSLYKFHSDFFGDIGICTSPYDDADFARLMTLASVWRAYKYLWNHVKYMGWQSFKFPDSEDGQIYFPPDYDEFIRSEVGHIRMHEVMAELVANPISRRLIGQSTDTLELVGRIANSITIPDIGNVWNGEISINAFRKAIERTWNASFGEATLDLLHYGPLLTSVKLGSSQDVVAWNTYWRVMDALRLLAKAFHTAVKRQVASYSASAALRKVMLVRRSHLASLISATTGIEVEACNKTLHLLTFNPKLTHLEIWDTPLIAAGDDLVLFVPTLIQNGSPVRAVENFIAQWNEELFAKRGKLLENEIRDFLKETVGVQAQGPIVFRTASGEEVECDIVAWWAGYLILIEAKCTKAVFSASDLYRARKRIEEAVEQLNLRRDAVITQWRVFQAAATDLDLPNEPPAPERIRLVAATNVLHLTGWNTQNVTVTDEFCIRRFFDSAEIEAFYGAEAKTIGRIRKSADPTIEEFLSYLENPPQVTFVRDCIKTLPVFVPFVKETDPKIAILHASYVAKDYEVNTSAQAPRI